jgi:hypothetical protein
MKKILLALVSTSILLGLGHVPASAADILSSRATSDWGVGYCYTFTLQNSTAQKLSNWQIQFKIKDDTSMTSQWSGDFGKVGTSYTIKPLDWNRDISVG